MRAREEIVSAIEIGTDKICVLIGCSKEDGSLELIGRGEVPSQQSVMKGEIFSMEEVFTKLNTAIEEADRASGGVFVRNRWTTVGVTGSEIDVFHSVGTVTIKNPEQKVGENDRSEAVENAEVHNLPQDQEIICSSESFFMLDGRRKIRNPIGQIARTLDAHIQIVRGDSKRIHNFTSVTEDIGIPEESIVPIFSGMASDMGILSEDDKKNGVLLVDFGAGTTEYMVEYNSGLLDGGVIKVGFEHLLNDLSVGLNVPISYCRKLTKSGELEKILNERRPFLDFVNERNALRRIPLNSIELIIEARLNELFDLIKGRLMKNGSLVDLNNGGVITGGGALLSRSREIFRDCFNFSVRTGQPINVIGASGEIASPRYGMVYGALRIADQNNRLFEAKNNNFSGMFSAIDNLINRTGQTFKNLKGVVKI